MKSSKKIAVVFFLVAVIGLLGGVAVWKFTQKEEDNFTLVGKKQSKNKKEAVRELNRKYAAIGETFLNLIKDNAYGGVLAADINRVLYFRKNNFLTVDFKGNSSVSVGGYPFKRIRDVLWSSNREKAIIESGEGFYLYDYNTDEVKKMKEGIDIIKWVPDSEKVIYKFFDAVSKSRTIDIADPDGSNWKTLISQVPHNLIDLAVNSRAQKVCFFQEPDGNNTGRCECVNSQNGERNVFHEGHYGADYLWSPNGKKMLFSYTREVGGNSLMLGIIDKDNNKSGNLSLPTTVEKCVWSKDNIHVYCGMMSSFPEEAVLPNDWVSGKYNSVDTFWRVNTETGKKKRILDVSKMKTSVDGYNFFMDREERNLFFTDKKTKGIFKVQIY